MLVIAGIELCLAHIALAKIWLDSSDERTMHRDDDDPSPDLRHPPSLRGESEEIYNLDKTYFQEVLNYQVGAVPADESKYPWIARVSHSPGSVFPYLCTAACISPKIFVTSARCLASVKIPYLSVLYQGTHFRVKALVIPNNMSKQWFDDTGVIVVRDNPAFQKTWSQITPTKLERVPDPRNEFRWFEELDYENGPIQHKVVAYAAEKFNYKLNTPDVDYKLGELPIVVGVEMCSAILSYNGKEFHVPCYMACTYDEYVAEHPNCKKYLGSEGGAIIDTKTGELLGIITWGIHCKSDRELPVGFSVINSNKFKNCVKCAQKLLSMETDTRSESEFARLCDYFGKNTRQVVG